VKNLAKIQSISASVWEFTGLSGSDRRLRRLKLNMIGRLLKLCNLIGNLESWGNYVISYFRSEAGATCFFSSGLAIGQFVPVLDLELTRDFRAPGNAPTHAELHRSNPKVCTELIPELEASGPS
jgi:hypothetical protein